MQGSLWAKTKAQSGHEQNNLLGALASEPVTSRDN